MPRNDSLYHFFIKAQEFYENVQNHKDMEKEFEARGYHERILCKIEILFQDTGYQTPKKHFLQSRPGCIIIKRNKQTGFGNTGGMMEEMIGQPEMAGGQSGDMVKQGRKRFSEIGLMFFLGTLIVYAVQIGFLALFSAIMPEWTQNSTARLMTVMLPMYVIALPLMILLIRRIPVAESRPVEPRRIGAGQLALAFFMCYAILYISNLTGSFITFFIGILKGSSVNNVVFDVTDSVSLWFNALVMVIVAPVFEEYIFRKLLVDRLVQFGEGAAVLTSALMFGLFHGNLNQFIYAFTLGLFLAFIYVKTRNIKYTVVLHMLVNLLGGVVSTWIMRSVGFVEAGEKLMSVPPNTTEQLMTLVQLLPMFMIMGTYVILLLAIVIIGVVMLCVFQIGRAHV